MAINDYDPLILGAAKQYDIDPRLLKGVMAVENATGDPNLVNPKSGAAGLMQFIPPTAQERKVDPYDPHSAVYGAASYISDLLDQWGSPEAALAHYSGRSPGYADAVLKAYHTVTLPGMPATPPAPLPDGQASATAQMPGVQPPSTVISPVTAADIAAGNSRNFVPPARAPNYWGVSNVAGSQQQHPMSAENLTPAPAPQDTGAVQMSPEDQLLLTGKSAPAATQKPAAQPAAPSASPPAAPDAVQLSPEDHQLLSPGTAPPPPPSPQPATPPPPQPAGPAAPPIYQGANIRPPGDDLSGLSPDMQRLIQGSKAPVPGAVSADTQRLIQGSNAPMPVPTGVPVPAITPENYSALAGFSHGARQAVNPLLETGSRVGNYLTGAANMPWLRTDRVANDAASEQQFQQQYGNDPMATGAARAARVGVPLVMGGALGTALRGGLSLAGLPQTGEFLSGVGGVGVPGALGWGQRIASGVTSGAVQGLATGGPSGAATGAILGGTLLPAVGGVASWLSGRTPQGAATQALAAIYRAAQRDRMTPADLEAAISRLGPNATLADAGGANLRQLGEGIANNPGPGQEIAVNFLRSRAEGQAERMTQAVRDATGATGSAFDNMQALKQTRAMNSEPAYTAAFNNTVVTPEQAAELSRFVATPIGQRALQNGMSEIQLEQEVAQGKPVNLAADYGVTQNPDGSYVLGDGAPNLRLYDAIKAGYDSLVERFRDPTSLRLNLSGTTSVPGMGGEVSGNALNSVRQAYTTTLRRLFPQYGDALDAWAGPSADMDALSLGRRLLTTDADQTAAGVAALSPSQQQMYQVGVAQALRDRIEGTAGSGTETAADATRRVFGNTQIRNRIAAGFGGADTPAYQNFENTMQREALFADVNRQMTQGSPTARRLAGMAEAQNPPVTPGNILELGGHLAGGNIPGAALGVARTLYAPVINRLTGPSDNYSAALGGALFNPTAAQQANALLQGNANMSLRDWIMGPYGQQAAQFLVNYPARVNGPQQGTR